MRNMKISTSRLAQICGVSQGTVDRALNGRKGISEKTKARIIAAAVQYGYRPPTDEKEGAKQIGIIVFNLNNEYLSSLVTEVEYAIRDKGYTATVMFSHYDKEYEIDCIKKLYAAGVDGIVLCSVNSGEQFVNFISSLGIPVICVGNRIEGIPYVGIDDFSAMKDMTRYVLSQGYKQIIYFSPALMYNDAYAQKQRFEGFMAGLAGFCDYTVVTELDQIKSNCAEDTAMICSTDYYALKAYFRGANADLFGFDNVKMIKDYGLPISSVDYSVKEIAENAVDAIFSKKDNDTIIPYHI